MFKAFRRRLGWLPIFFSNKYQWLLTAQIACKYFRINTNVVYWPQCFVSNKAEKSNKTFFLLRVKYCYRRRIKHRWQIDKYFSLTSYLFRNTVSQTTRYHSTGVARPLHIIVSRPINPELERLRTIKKILAVDSNIIRQTPRGNPAHTRSPRTTVVPRTICTLYSLWLLLLLPPLFTCSSRCVNVIEWDGSHYYSRFHEYTHISHELIS